jgi:NADH-quinone oxidoreductase subunit C
MNIQIEKTLELIKENISPIETRIVNDQIEIIIDKEKLISSIIFLKDNIDCQFKQLTDLAGVDYPGRKSRFEIVYHLLSFKFNFRIRVKVLIDEDSSIESLTPVFPCANWFEREAFDMYGIQFIGHPDMRRILTDYGFEGHPLRKDFPLTGNVEVRYNEIEKKVVYEPVKLQQDYRNFDIQSPWEGTKYKEEEIKE